MHAKTDSEGTSIDASWPVRSPRRPVYYVQSPYSNQEVDKMSYSSSPTASPMHHYYQCSPTIHHSRVSSSTSRLSASVKNLKSLSAWKHVQIGHGDDEGDDDEMVVDGRDGRRANKVRLFLCLVFLFLALFIVIALILCGASKRYEPKIFAKHVVFENLYYQAGNDESGVPTDMLSLNSTVKISYRNPATFYAVHIASTPWELHHFELKIASGQMKKFTQPKQSQREVVTIVQGYQVPLYGGIPVLVNTREHLDSIAVPLNLTFVMRSRAYIMGRLVKTEFFGRFRCSVTLLGNKLGKPLNLADSCIYQ